MISVNLKKNKETGDSYIDIIDLEEIVDISKVKKYTLDVIEKDGSKGLVVRFFDEKGKVINTPPPLIDLEATAQTLDVSIQVVKEYIVNKVLKNKKVNNDTYCFQSQVLRLKEEREKAKQSVQAMDEDGFGND